MVRKSGRRRRITEHSDRRHHINFVFFFFLFAACFPFHYFFFLFATAAIINLQCCIFLPRDKKRGQLRKLLNFAISIMHTSNSRSQPRLNCFSTKIRRKSRTSFDTFAAQASPVASVCSSSRSSSTLSPAASARSSMKDSERRPSSGSSKSSSRKGDVRELRIQLAGIPDPSMLDVGTGGRTSSRILTAGRATQQKQFYDSHLRQGRQANAIRPRLSPGSTKSVKREMMARAREREKDTSEIKIGGYVYENGRVANKRYTR